MKNSEVAIKVSNLEIDYRELQKTSIRASWFKKKQKVSVFKALSNVSFEVEKGKIVGIIGQNGAGKSTLLRAVAGIFSPDKGKINLFGNTVSLLSIGVGFNRKLTGYENIYLSGMLLGFNEEQIKEKEKEIIEFADIGDFIYKPVKTYSSGMYSKLAFAITAILETDIMLIDEVLSVGDIRFKEKSFNKMKELISDDDRTVLIVSHNINTISSLCDEVIWLEKGEVVEIGKTKDVVQKYNDFINELKIKDKKIIKNK